MTWSAIAFAKVNHVCEVGVVFPDGDVHLIPPFVRGVHEPGQQDTTPNDN